MKTKVNLNNRHREAPLPTKVFAKAGLDIKTSAMCRYQQRFRFDIQFSALVHNFNNIFSIGHLYRAGRSMNSLPSQILERCSKAKRPHNPILVKSSVDCPLAVRFSADTTNFNSTTSINQLSWDSPSLTFRKITSDNHSYLQLTTRKTFVGKIAKKNLRS